ncbi:MAG: GNAT family N-acetyltransferase [Saprospiraceae bacterium]|nr:GNAT family N-acetyltransferase [Saprospiraceae bacterium]
MIETQRLLLKPLTGEELELYAQNDGSLEKRLGLMPSERQISPELKEALEETILPGVRAVTAKTDPTNAASLEVLKKNGFQKTAEAEDFIHWIFRLEGV